MWRPLNYVWNLSARVQVVTNSRYQTVKWVNINLMQFILYANFKLNVWLKIECFSLTRTQTRKYWNGVNSIIHGWGEPKRSIANESHPSRNNSTKCFWGNITHSLVRNRHLSVSVKVSNPYAYIKLFNAYSQRIRLISSAITVRT